MKILFISHTYPPIVGGVENQNYELYTHLSRLADVRLIANRQRFLIPFFLVYVSIAVIFLSRKYDAILLGSCLLANVGWTTKLFSRKPVIAVAHGLDITWKNPFYQKLWVKFFIPSMNKLIAVGNETIRAGVSRGIPSEKFIFLPNGVNPDKNLVVSNRQELEKILKEDLENKKVLLTSGRLAKRKGVAWFVREVFPRLEKNIFYVIAGDGADKEAIRQAIAESPAKERIRALGYINDATRNLLFNTADIFIQPNIEIEGDIEGFGISVIEAGACRLPVVAARLEGLKDAICDGQNGILVESKNANDYVKKINFLLSDEKQRQKFGEKTREFVKKNYSWEKIAGKYLEEIKKVISQIT